MRFQDMLLEVLPIVKKYVLEESQKHDLTPQAVKDMLRSLSNELYDFIHEELFLELDEEYESEFGDFEGDQYEEE